MTIADMLQILVDFRADIIDFLNENGVDTPQTARYSELMDYLNMLDFSGGDGGDGMSGNSIPIGGIILAIWGTDKKGNFLICDGRTVKLRFFPELADFLGILGEYIMPNLQVENYNAYMNVGEAFIPVVTAMQITTQPSRLIYADGDELDLTGLEVRLTLENNAAETIPHTDLHYFGITASPAHGDVLAYTLNGSPVVLSVGDISISTNQLTVMEVGLIRISPIMTSDTAPPPYAVSVSSIYNTGYPGWRAFDGSATNNQYWCSANNSFTRIGVTTYFEGNEWIQIDLAEPVLATHFVFYNGYIRGKVRDFAVLGSNDGLQFDILLTVTDLSTAEAQQPFERRQFTLTANGSYRYYRMLITMIDNIYVGIGEIEILQRDI